MQWVNRTRHRYNVQSLSADEQQQVVETLWKHLLSCTPVELETGKHEEGPKSNHVKALCVRMFATNAPMQRQYSQWTHQVLECRKLIQ